MDSAMHFLGLCKMKSKVFIQVHVVAAPAHLNNTSGFKFKTTGAQTGRNLNQPFQL